MAVTVLPSHTAQTARASLLTPLLQSLIVRTELQALVYDILPPTTAIIDYAIGLEKLSANGQLFVGAKTNGIKFVADNLNYVRRLESRLI